MSLVELMVALVIGLIVSLAVFSVMSSFEARKRTASSVNDIDQVGNYASFALDKWVRSAGSGFTQGEGEYLGCKLTAAHNGTQILPRSAALPAPFASLNAGVQNVFKLIPVLIVPGATIPAVSGVASDALVVMAGAAGAGEVATTFVAAPSDAQLNVYSTQGFAASDQVLILDTQAAAAGDPCLIEEVSSAFAGGSTQALPLAANTNNAHYYYQATINGVNLSTAFPLVRAEAVLNLGNVSKGNPPAFVVLGVGDNNTLFGFDLLENQNPVSDNKQESFQVADGVFEMHALYGVDSDSDGKVDRWMDASGDFSPGNLTAGTSSSFKSLTQIKAIRVALIMRTATPEKDAVSNNGASTCQPAPNALSYFCDVGKTATRRLSEGEQHFRYRVVETTIPLRNMLMVPSKAG